MIHSDATQFCDPFTVLKGFLCSTKGTITSEAPHQPHTSLKLLTHSHIPWGSQPTHISPEAPNPPTHPLKLPKPRTYISPWGSLPPFRDKHSLLKRRSWWHQAQANRGSQLWTCPTKTTHQRPKPPPTPPGVNLLVPLCSAERLGQSQGCISSCVCPKVLHHVEMEMRVIQVNVDGYTKLNMTLNVHHCAKIHQ